MRNKSYSRTRGKENERNVEKGCAQRIEDD